jgi:hypothetical protein
MKQESALIHALIYINDVRYTDYPIAWGGRDYVVWGEIKETKSSGCAPQYWLDFGL